MASSMMGGLSNVWRQPKLPFHSTEGQGLNSPVGSDREMGPQDIPTVLLVKLGTKHLALC